jgi:ABC-type nickel/cobalt efflux system permease component RcnA
MVSNFLLLTGGLAMCLWTSWRLSMLAFTSIGPIIYITAIYAVHTLRHARARAYIHTHTHKHTNTHKHTHTHTHTHTYTGVVTADQLADLVRAR